MSNDSIAARLEQIVGAENVSTPGDISLGGVSPESGTVSPDSFEQVQEVVRFCHEQRLPVAAVGSGTRTWQCSSPDRLSVLISMRRLSSVTDYQPENLVLAAQAGMTGEQTARLLAERSQVLTLDPPGFASSALGSMAATRTAGPARAQFGTPKDLLIGATVVNADGQITKAGGKVMKHVAGYDLSKLYAGSYGTLGIIVETIWKLSPLPMHSVAAVAMFEDLAAAEALASAVSESYLQLRSLDLLNRAAATELGLDWPDAAVAALAGVFDGGTTQADHQAARYAEMAAEAGALATTLAEGTWNGQFHRALADAGVPGCDRLWEVYGPPAMLPQVFAAGNTLEGAAVSGSAHSGVVRVASSEATEAEAAELSRALGAMGGLRFAAFSKGPRTAASVWETEPDGLGPMRAIKGKLDPDGVFAAGRFVGGI